MAIEQKQEGGGRLSMNNSAQTTKQLIHGLSEIRLRIAELDKKTPADEQANLENTLTKVRDELEMRVAQRTANLQRANQRLQAEILQRKQVEEALRDSQEQLKAIFETVSDAIVTVDLHNVLTSVNRTAEVIFGYRRNVMVGKPLDVFLTPESAMLARERTQKAIKGESLSSSFELEGQHQGKTKVPLEAKACLLYDGEKPIGLVCVFRDITERKRLAEQLRQAQKMEAIGTLAGGIAHDFNNILSAIIGYTELAIYDIPQASPLQDTMQEVLTAGNRAKDLVQQILTFSHRHEHEHNPIHLHLIVNEALKLLRASLPTTIDIQSYIRKDIGQVLADPTQIHQVLMNLCTNAGHAMQDRGGLLEIRLDPVDIDSNDIFTTHHSTLQPGPHICLKVCDTGHGMSSEVLERIFEPFFTTKEIGQGTGMGLAVVHGIVTSHNGAITVQSSPGQGTTVKIYLPCIKEIGASVELSREPIPHGKECILFVDDEVVLTRLGHAMLERLGYNVVTRASSIEALATFRASPQRFDLVITDQTMPQMTGEQLTKELRQIRPDMPIILCTGFSHTMNADKAQTLEIDGFLMKPLLIDHLGREIRRVFGLQLSKSKALT
ncbi:MAG: PAS domain S-box protein [bacterium]|nr:PAS domain S-box protein [bacterium]